METCAVSQNTACGHMLSCCKCGWCSMKNIHQVAVSFNVLASWRRVYRPQAAQPDTVLP
jgi:hypothetical protein